jgi:cytochrome c556
VDDQISISPPFLPVASIQDLMESQIDPAADFIWGSVGTFITAAGVDDRQPHTDEEWRQVRRKVVALIEATNLLTIPGRRVASSDFPSAGPGVLSSAEIECKVAADRAQFDAFAVSLREVALQELADIDHKDAAALAQAGEAMDGACEACHRANWYPHEIIPQLPDFKPE